MKVIDADQLTSHIVLYDGKFHRMVFQKDIDQLAKQRQGEWIEDGYNDLPCVCSNCGHEESIKAKFLYSFCPNCGARMEGVKQC